MDIISISREAGVIPFRQDPDGLKILLLASRETGGWAIPRGHVGKGLTAVRAAEAQARRLAGVKGVLSPAAVGAYVSRRSLSAGNDVTVTVEVFSLKVTKQSKISPARQLQHSEWLSPAIASELVDEHALAKLLLRLSMTERKDCRRSGGDYD